MVPHLLRYLEAEKFELNLNMSDITESFKQFSFRVGTNFNYVQGAGGNSSIKINDRKMLIKASGKWLKNALDEDIFVAVDWQHINKAIATDESRALDSALNTAHTSAFKPSIETTMHSLMPHKVVLHTHSLNALTILVQQDCKTLLEKKLQGINWSFIPYCRPGFPLTQLVQKATTDKECDVLLIQNHGLVVGGSTPEKTLTSMLEIEKRLSINPSEQKNLKTTTRQPIENKKFLFSDSDVINRIAFNDNTIRIATGGSLYPDHVVFLGSGLAFAENIPTAISSLQKCFTEPLHPKAVIVSNQGVIHSRNLSPAGVEMLLTIAKISSRIPKDAQIKYLTKSEELDLITWDKEQYRQKPDNS